MYAFMKPGQSAPMRIVIFRALHLGDMLNAVPAFRTLKTAIPDSHITLMGLPWSIEFAGRFQSYLDDFISFPGFPGLSEQTPDISSFPSFLGDIQAKQFDLAIQMHGSGEVVNPLISLFGAKQSAGFYLPGQYRPNRNWFLEYPEHESEVWRLLRLMELLGIPLQGDELELPIFEADWEELRQLQAKFNLQREYICIHPGAHARERRWPAHNFAIVADRLAAHGYQVVLTGTEKEAHLTASVALHMKSSAIDLAGMTSLGTLGALISKARLVVSNNTGISHVAAAVKTPSVILFPVLPSIHWAPGNEQLHKRIWQAMEKEPEEIWLHVESHLKDIPVRV